MDNRKSEAGSTAKSPTNVTDVNAEDVETPGQLVEKFTALTLEDIEFYMDADLKDWPRINEVVKSNKDRILSERIINKQPRRSHLRDQVINLVLLGKTGTGKSATANLIIGDNIFKESTSFESCTQQIQKSECMVDKVKVNIIDTPGFGDTKLALNETCTEISKVMEVFSDGIDGLLFVFNMGNPRFTKDEKAVFNFVEKGVFGESAIDNCFVILTHIGSKKGIESLSKYLEDERNTAFGQLLSDKLQKRVIAVDNCDETLYGRNAQKDNIIQLILARKGKRFFPEQFEEHQKAQLREAGELPDHIRFLAPQLQKETSAVIQPMGHWLLKGLKGKHHLVRRSVVDETVEKMMGLPGVNVDWKPDIRRAVEFTLDNAVDRVIGLAYWKKLGLTLLLFTIPSGVAIASLVAPGFRLAFAAAGGAILLEAIRRERDALE